MMPHTEQHHRQHQPLEHHRADVKRDAPDPRTRDDAGVEDSSVVILDWKQPFQTPYPALSALPSTRVRLAFFDRSGNTSTPSYEVGMRYWENGVADNLQMDFGDFAMNAKISEFNVLPRKC